MSRVICRTTVVLSGALFVCAAIGTWLFVPLPEPDLAVAIISELDAVQAAPPPSYDIIESLENPVSVAGWSQAGLTLATGVTLKLPGIARLPASSPPLAMAIKQGVDVRQDQHVIGLLQIWHWCGNDPVGRHLARVDLSSLLLFLGEAEPSPDFAVSKPPEYKESMGFSEYGWAINEFQQYQAWLEGNSQS